jgi:hypothetical protein
MQHVEAASRENLASRDNSKTLAHASLTIHSPLPDASGDPYTVHLKPLTKKSKQASSKRGAEGGEEEGGGEVCGCSSTNQDGEAAGT